MRDIEIHGHRGARGLAPENTLVGFARTLALGVDALEMDVGMTSDGVVVVTHDPALNPEITRDADGTWLRETGPPILSLSCAELLRFDVGRIKPDTAYAAAFPDQVPHDGARIPTLSEVLELDPRIRLNIELKTFPDPTGLTVAGPVLAEAVVALALAAGAAGRIIVQSFDWSGLRYLQRAHPQITLAWLTTADTPAAPQAVAAAGGRTWAPDHRALTADLLAEARALGLRVVPWTVNDPADMTRLMAWNVDGLITDRPDLVRKARQGEGAALDPLKGDP